MKKNIVIILILMSIMFFSVTMVWLKNNNQGKINENKIREKNSIAIMVYDETAKDYIHQSAIPKGNYEINTEKTKCIAGGTVSNYNSTAGTISYSLSAGDSCTVYFDIRLSKIAPTLALSTNSLSSSTGGYCNAVNHDITYTYDGDGTITCSVDKGGECSVNQSSKTITVKRYSYSSSSSSYYPTKITINASEGNNYTATSTIINYSVTCLDGDTLVAYWDSKKKKKLKKKIKKIKVGDIIYSYNYQTDTIVTRKVKKVHINKAKEIYHLIFADDTIKITGNHPVCVEGVGYLNVSELKVGYKVLGQDNIYYEIKDIKLEILKKEKNMYCLELEDGTAFLSGKNGIICLAMFVSAMAAMLVAPEDVSAACVY